MGRQAPMLLTLGFMLLGSIVAQLAPVPPVATVTTTGVSGAGMGVPDTSNTLGRRLKAQVHDAGLVRAASIIVVTVAPTVQAAPTVTPTVANGEWKLSQAMIPTATIAPIATPEEPRLSGPAMSSQADPTATSSRRHLLQVGAVTGTVSPTGALTSNVGAIRAPGRRHLAQGGALTSTTSPTAGIASNVGAIGASGRRHLVVLNGANAITASPTSTITSTTG